MRGDRVIYIIGMSMFQIRQNEGDSKLKGFQSQDSEDKLSIAKEVPGEKTQDDNTWRLRKPWELKVQPIQYSDSEPEEDLHLDLSTTAFNTSLYPKRQIRKQPKPNPHKQTTKKKAEKLSRRQEKRKLRFEWDVVMIWGLPQQCMQINQIHKEQCYKELSDSILSCLRGRSNNRVIFFIGDGQTAKKTVLFDVLRKIKERQGERVMARELFLSFEESIDNNVDQKLIELYDHLKESILDNIKSLLKENHEGNTDQTRGKSWKVQNIIVIDDYKTFVASLCQSKIRDDFRTILRANRSNLLIFIDSNITKKQMGLLLPDCYNEVSMPRNNKEYFMASLMASVNNYPFTNARWELLRPLANYFSTKMEQANTLNLSIIRKFITFLENEDPGASQALRVNRDILQRFTSSITDRSIKIDLKRLTIHEKSTLTACYLTLKEQPQLLIPKQKLYSRYVWVCESISMNAKSFNQFTCDTIYQLQIYKMIKLQRGRVLARNKQVLLLLDLDTILFSFHQDFCLSKFFPS